MRNFLVLIQERVSNLLFHLFLIQGSMGPEATALLCPHSMNHPMLVRTLEVLGFLIFLSSSLQISFLNLINFLRFEINHNLKHLMAVIINNLGTEQPDC